MSEPIFSKILLALVILVAVIGFFVGLFKFYKTLGTEASANNLSIMLLSFVVLYVGTCVYGKIQ